MSQNNSSHLPSDGQKKKIFVPFSEVRGKNYLVNEHEEFHSVIESHLEDFSDSHDKKKVEENEQYLKDKEKYATPKKKEKKVIKHNLFFEILINIALFVTIIFVMRNFIALPFEVSGDSMEPNLHNKERIYVDKLIPRFKDYERGQVIVFNPPVERYVQSSTLECNIRKVISLFTKESEDCMVKASYVKRIIGIAGDTILIKNGHVYLTPQGGESIEITESFLSEFNKGKTCIPASECLSAKTLRGEVYEVPEGHYFVLGDNRQGSSDSRAWPGNYYVARNDIIGIVRAVFFSPQLNQDIMQSFSKIRSIEKIELL